MRLPREIAELPPAEAASAMLKWFEENHDQIALDLEAEDRAADGWVVAVVRVERWFADEDDDFELGIERQDGVAWVIGPFDDPDLALIEATRLDNELAALHGIDHFDDRVATMLGFRHLVIPLSKPTER